MQTHHALIRAPFGAVSVSGCGNQLALEFLTTSSSEQVVVAETSSEPLVQRACEQIVHYLHDATFSFAWDITQLGTAFQQRVWHAIKHIPPGETRTYSQIAQMVGSGSRAVANACGANHLPIFVPCHRVVAKNGLGGFMQGKSGGLFIKQWLLRHEGVLI